MNQVNKERIKSIALTALLIISLIQVGILWSYQSHRLPISFLSGIFGGRQIQVSDEITREELFVPYRLVISNGETSHWTLDRKDQLYKPLWDEVKTYLNDMVNGNILPVEDNQEGWGGITSKRGFVFEFKTGILPDLLKWFLGNPSSTANIPAVYKVMVVPESSDETRNTVYIYDMDGKVSKYLTKGFTRKKSFEDIMSVFEKEGGDTYREYITMHDSNFESTLSVEPDVLYVATRPVLWPYSIISCSIPGSLKNTDGLAGAILGSEKERYEQNIFKDGTTQFSNTANIYKISPNGTLEYEYLSDDGASGRENIGAALLNAYNLIKKASSLTGSKADIYLSGIELLQTGNYRFTFDYMINGRPIYINISSGVSGEKPVRNAFTIEANSKRILKSFIVIRDFAAAGEKEYNDRFFDIMENSKFGHNQLQLKDLEVGYAVGSLDGGNTLEPSMILQSKGSPELITEKMPGQKGD